MNEPDLDISDDRHDPLLEALARTPDVEPFIGTERYRVRRCLGEGGFGVVYEVEDVQLGRCLALKTLRPERTGFSANIRRLKREFRSVADLVHPNLVALHELSSEGARWFFTMDLVRGHDFFEYVRGETAAAYAHTAKAADAPPRRDTSGILSESRLRASLRQLVAGVGALHQAGIIHRDLKPSNVLVEPDGRVVILDFGLAGGEVHADPEMSVDLAGTPAYMAPEQASGEAVTAAADWYAVGVMLYEALTGELPFADGGADVRMMHAKCTRDPAPPSSHARVPADLERLCLALLARKAETRPDARAILEALGDATPARANSQQAAARAAFVGRDQDLAALRDAYAAVRRGEPRLVRIHGEPGVGKSALVGRFLEEVREQGDAAVLAGRCYEREAVPFKAFDGIADALVRYLRALPRREASALMPRDVHLVTQLFPVLDGVAAVRDVPRRQAAQVDPRAARQRAFAALKELIARIADKQPLVVAIDDLQWGDVDSARLLAQLVGQADRPAVMLVLSHRTAGDDDATLMEMLRMLDAAGDPGQEIRLLALTEDDALDLATRLLGAAGASAAARAIASRGEGHPLLMAELARALLSKGSSDAGAPTLIDILWQRVVRLSESSRALLETVAVAGQPLSSGLCFEAAGLDASGTDAVRALRAEQLIVTSDTGAINVFHDRIRDAVLARTGVGTRRMRHLALARTLERRADADPETLARHFDAGDEQERAGRHAVRAGDAAMRMLAFDRAAALYRMAIDRGLGSMPAHSSLHEKFGDALLCAGSNAEAGEAYLAAAAHADGAHAVRLTARAAEQLLSVGRVEAGHEAIERALAAVGERLPRSRGRSIFEAIWHLSLMRIGGFRLRERPGATIPPAQLLRLDVLEAAANGLLDIDFAGSFGLLMRFCRLALKTGEPRRAAMGSILCTIALEGNSRPEAVEMLLGRAESIAERLTDWNLRAKAMRLRVMSLFMYGDLPRARECAEAGAALISERCAGMGIDLRFLRMITASMDADLGELGRARLQAESQLLDAVERRDPVAERGVIICALVPVCLAADEPDRAADYLERAKDEDRCANVLFARMACASLAMYLGRPREAVDGWRSRWAEIEEAGLLHPPGFRLVAVRSLGMALLAQPAGAGELREAARLASRIRRLSFPLAEAIHRTLRAYLAVHRGDAAAAISLLDDAAERFERASLPLDAAAMRYRAGSMTAGEEGTRRAAEALEVLRGRGVVDPERWAAMVAPPVATKRLTA